MADESNAAITGNPLPAAGTVGGDAAAQAAAAALKAAGPDLTTLKLDGATIPEKFRGKTLPEVLEAIKGLEAQKTKSEQTVKDWNTWYQKNIVEKQNAGGGAIDEQQHKGTGRSGRVNPLEVFDESQVGALGELFEVGMSPVVGSLSAIFKEAAKAARPDWSTFEERASEIYNNMPLQHKLDPKYGWVFAYNMSKAEKMGTEPPPAAPNTVGTGGPSGAAKAPVEGEEEISDAELAWMQKFGIKDKEEAKKYQVPRES